MSSETNTSPIVDGLRRTLKHPINAIVVALDASERRKQRVLRDAGVETKRYSDIGLTREELEFSEQSP